MPAAGPTQAHAIAVVFAPGLLLELALRVDRVLD
jgi:hypothetical protein